VFNLTDNSSSVLKNSGPNARRDGGAYVKQRDIAVRSPNDTATQKKQQPFVANKIGRGGRGGGRGGGGESDRRYQSPPQAATSCDSYETDYDQDNVNITC